MDITKQIEKQRYQEQEDNNNDRYSLYVYAIRSPVTRETYRRRLIFFNHFKFYRWMNLSPPLQHICSKGYIKSKWVFSKILEFLQFQKEKVENQEISLATLRNFVKAIKLF